MPRRALTEEKTLEPLEIRILPRHSPRVKEAAARVWTSQGATADYRRATGSRNPLGSSFAARYDSSSFFTSSLPRNNTLCGYYIRLVYSIVHLRGKQAGTRRRPETLSNDPISYGRVFARTRASYRVPARRHRLNQSTSSAFHGTRLPLAAYSPCQRTNNLRVPPVAPPSRTSLLSADG